MLVAGASEPANLFVPRTAVHLRMNRPDNDTYFMRMAELVATRSTCLRRQVGAVVVKEKRVLSTGYNGAPKGLKHCAEVGCVRMQNNIESGTRHELCRGVHAEQNAVIQAAYFGVSIKDASLYTTNFPCVMCAKILINAGIREVVYKDEYIDELSQEILNESKVLVRRL